MALVGLRRNTFRRCSEFEYGEGSARCRGGPGSILRLLMAHFVGSLRAGFVGNPAQSGPRSGMPHPALLTPNKSQTR
jgi:hypothetical protein